MPCVDAVPFGAGYVFAPVLQLSCLTIEGTTYSRTLGMQRMDTGSNVFAIVTTEANELISRIHPRIPVILHPREYDRWLDREETDRLPLDLLLPYESEEM